MKCIQHTMKENLLFLKDSLEPITGSLYEKELQETNQEEFRIEEVLLR